MLSTSRGRQSAGARPRDRKAIGHAGINMSFVMAQVVGRRYSALFGFENDAYASKAATLFKRAMARGRK
jgi:hypothetical protein